MNTRGSFFWKLPPCLPELPSAILLAMLPVLETAAQPQSTTPLVTDLAACTSIADPERRLGCFDRATETLAGEDVETADENFGIEQLAEESSTDDLVSTLVGSFGGWKGNTRFELENGQVWEQIDSSYLYARSEKPQVTIRLAAFGSYLLSVEGIGRTVRVRRVK